MTNVSGPELTQDNAASDMVVVRMSSGYQDILYHCIVKLYLSFLYTK